MWIGLARLVVTYSAASVKEISLEKDRLESKMNPTFLAEDVGGMGYVEGRESDGWLILEVSCRSLKRRNSGLEGLRMR